MQYTIDTKRQYEIIKATIDSDTTKILKEHKGFIAGGAISSLFTNRPIRDWDIFFPELTVDPATILTKNNGWKPEFTSMLTNTYDRSVVVTEEDQDYGKTVSKNIQLQLVTAFFGSPLDIFQMFDFYCCMGAYSFETEEFIFDPAFLTDNMNKQLRYNYDGECNPLHSLFRVEKYKQYGYTISTTELIKILFAIRKMKIDTFKDFKKCIKTLPPGVYKKVILDEMYEKRFATMKNLSTPEGKQQYEEYMNQPFDFDACVAIISDISPSTKPSKIDVKAKDDLDDELL